MNAIEKILAYADAYGSIIPLLTILIIYKKREMPASIRLITGYLLFSVIIFGISNYLADRSINNLFLYHVLSIGEFTLLSFYFKVVITNIWFKKIINYVLIVFCLCFILNSIFLERFTTMNSNILSIEFLLLIIFCFYYYFNLTKTDDILIFYKTPTFWIVSGLFIYFSTTIMTFALYKYAVKNSRSFALNFWKFQMIMFLVKNVLIAKGILCFKTKK